ncbi:hypothetical protein D0Z07_8581 [Hyphodiscus hymeniophilus]|uniref:Uncharacterized protein n=1 Tax=Hyphodiscus hymeniophilus TaxID=353542 RepID=A0A9P6VCF6_9HELO|nr:hypothetical protein D0Z07_8581 [Hyphodiscus hymeniophilus]
MSTEVVKKRGRPKKVISDPVDIDTGERKKSTTRAKSTKAAPKPAKTTPIVTKKTPIVTTASKSAPNSSPTAKTTPKSPILSSSEPAKTSPKLDTRAPSAPPPKTPVTPETSKILDQVRELSAERASSSPDPAKLLHSSPNILSPEAPSQHQEPPLPPKAPSPSVPPLSKKPISKPSQVPPPASKPPSQIPLAALNSEIVSNISSRAGARPNTGAAGKLPVGYKSAARKWTAAIVAMPILLVTSYVLYERLVLGEDKKVLVRPGLTPVEAPRSDVTVEKS